MEGILRIALGAALGLAVAYQVKLVILAAVGLVGVAVGVAYPPVLVAAMYAGMLFDRLGTTGESVGDFPVTASKLTVAASVGIWAVCVALRGGVPVRWHRVGTAMLVVMAAMSVSIVWNNAMEHGKFPLYGIGMMLVMVILVSTILAEARLEPLFRFLAVVLLAAIAAGLRVPMVEGADGRVSGTMGDPNEWATTIVLLAPLLLGGLATDTHLLGRLLRMGLVVLVPLGVLRSESRAALVVMALITPGCLYLLRNRRGELWFCLAAAALAAPLVIDLETALARFWSLMGAVQGEAHARDASFVERSELFRQGVQLFADRWVIGAGPGNFESATGFISEIGTLRPAHNTYLEIASEQGIVGLIPALAFMLTVAATLRDAWRAAVRERDRNRVLGAALGLSAFALMAATLGLITFAMGYLVLGVALAIVHQTHQPDDVAG